MKQRMKLLGVLLAGTIAVGSFGVSDVKAGQTLTGRGTTAGVSGLLMEMLEDSKTAEQELVAAVEQESAAAERAFQAEQEAKTDTAEAAIDGAEPSEHEDIAIAQVNNYVNVREQPSTESEVLGKLYNNSAATVLETTEDGWYRVSSGNVEGYVKAEYVVVGDEELAREVGTRYATVTTTTLFVRKEPTTEAKILTMLPEGDDLVVSDESVEGWAKVSTEEGDGYISTEYATLSTEYVHAESKQEEEERLAREEAERKAAAEAAEAARREREAAEAAKRAQEAAKKQQSASNSSTGNSSSNSSSSNSSAGSSSSNSSSSNSSAGSGSSNSSSSGSTSSAGSSAGSSSGNAGSSSSSSVSNGQAVVDYAKQFVGNPYVYGGTSLTNGADCSGFVMSVYKAFGVDLPRTSAQQRSAGYAVNLSDIQPGDIVCYSGHVGIYAGNNTLLHASNEKTGITYTSPITYRKILAVRRIF